MSGRHNTTRPDGFEILSGPFPLIPHKPLWWISLVRTPAGNEAGVYIHSDQDGARTFLYPEEALTALDILERMQPQLREILAQQGRQTQLGSDEEVDASHNSSVVQELSEEKTEPGKSCRDERR